MNRAPGHEGNKLSDWTREQVKRHCKTIFGTARLRMHKAFALTWDCFDFQKNVILVTNREATPQVPPFSIKDREQRRIPLPSRAIDLLTQWQTEAPEGIPFVLLTKERYEPVKAKWQQVQAEGRPWKNSYLVNNVLRKFKNP